MYFHVMFSDFGATPLLPVCLHYPRFRVRRHADQEGQYVLSFELQPIVLQMTAWTTSRMQEQAHESKQ